jgi:hypothetical protein
LSTHRIARRLLFAGLVLAIGCKKADGVVVVAVGADPSIADVARLHVTMTVAAETRTHDFALREPGTLTPARETTFSISATSQAGPLAVSVAALDTAGHTVAVGQRMGIEIPAGQIASVDIMLAPDGSCVWDGPDSTFDHCVFAP